MRRPGLRQRKACLIIPLLVQISVAGISSAYAQNRGAAPATPRAQAPIDMTGYWASFVTEDWRYRMQTPPKGDYAGVPMTPDARKIADAWDPAADEAAGNQCKSYGAAAIMRVPTRIHITWEDENTLRMETDAGTQTRILHFGPAPAATGAPAWQGYSSAQWERPASGGGSLKVTTTSMRSGYLRKNGIPYSENAVLTEYYDLAPLPGGGLVLAVTAVVDDPRYLQTPLIVASHFKKEVDGSKWDPTPCSAK